jgi:hypothetical protein
MCVFVFFSKITNSIFITDNFGPSKIPMPVCVHLRLGFGNFRPDAQNQTQLLLFAPSHRFTPEKRSPKSNKLPKCVHSQSDTTLKENYIEIKSCDGNPIHHSRYLNCDLFKDDNGMIYVR